MWFITLGSAELKRIRMADKTWTTAATKELNNTYEVVAMGQIVQSLKLAFAFVQ